MSETDLKRSAFAADTDDVWLVLLTITHPDITDPIRVVNNVVNVTSRGDEFIAYAFDLILPDSRDESPPRARLSIDNVSTDISAAIRSMTQTPPSVTIEVIRAAAPDTVERTFDFFKMRNIKWDAGKVSGDLTVEDFMSEPYPALVFSPAYFPGLF